ncbi:MAG: YaiO family outer membrane beta-barrel protein [Deltaproteobacteria bacterium]|nr:YaiO family outer membrane beta-barrel protein [Deltaproteobacteria bacterium]
MDVGGGLQDFNYTTDAPGSYAQVVYKQPKKYFLLGRFDYLDKFADKTFTPTLGGGYYVLPRLILQDQIAFSPGAQVVPQFSNLFEISGILPKGFAPYLRYGYRHYSIADLNLITPGLAWYAGDWGVFEFNYTLSVNDLTTLGSTELDNSFMFRITLIPIMDRLKFRVLYARTEESFDAGSPVNPLGSFHANHVGGGFEWAFLKNLGVRFDFDYENRDNGQTVHTYDSGIFFLF